MALDTVYEKTQLGRLEVKTRSNDLTPIQRRILILADGRRTAENILKFSRVVNYQRILDELVDAGMDISGVESSMAVLKDMSRTQKKNIFLISHKDELVSRVNSVLKVVKENGFTNYANDVDIII